MSTQEDLQAKVNDLLAEMIRGGSFDEMIRSKIEKTLEAIVDSELCRYSAFGKALSDQVGKALNINLGELGLGGYNLIVAQIVKDRIEHQINGEWKTKLEKEVDDLLRAGPPEIKLSELFENFMSDWVDEARENDWEHATILVEKSEFGSTWIHMDPEPKSERDKYRFMLRLQIGNKGDLGFVEYDEKWSARKRPEKNVFSSMYGIEKRFFQLRAGTSRLVVDLKPGLHEEEYPEPECECD